MTSGENNATNYSEARLGLNWKGVVQLLIGIGALALLFARSDLRGIAEAIRRTRLEFLPLAVLASFVVTWLMAFRWRVILESRGHRIETRRLFGYYLIASFFTNFLPGGSLSGDAARLIYVNRQVGDKALVLSTLIYERLIGVFALFLVGLLATLLSHVYVQTDPTIYISEGVLGLAFIAIAMLMSEFVSARLARLIEALGNKLRLPKIGSAVARTILEISSLRRNKRLFASTLIVSFLIRIVWSAGCYLVSLAMGLPLGITLVFSFISLADLVRLMPISIGGLGVREWALIALFAGVGLQQERALTFSLLAFAPLYLNAIVGGIVYVSGARIRKRTQAVGELDLDSPAA
jgi:uncharacterized protein (TIRG00374 family)